MPGMDGTGPLGYGPGMGGGFGRCGFGRRSGCSRRYIAGHATAAFESQRTPEATHNEPETHRESAFGGRMLAELDEVKDRSAALEEKLTELTKAVQAFVETEFSKARKAEKPH